MIEYNKPVFTKKVDDAGRIYYTGYANIETNSVISIGKKNYVIEGNPKINWRVGDSQHGNELFIEHMVTGKVKQTPKNSNHNSIEIYFPDKMGIQFFKNFITFIEGNKI